MCQARALRARKTLTPRFTDFFTDFEKKPTVLQSTCLVVHGAYFSPFFSIPQRSLEA